MSDVTEYFRLFIATSLFCIGIYLMFDLATEGFDFLVLVAIVLSFWLAHVIKPKLRRTNIDGWDFYDIVYLVTDIPYRGIVILLRSSWHIFGHAKDHID